MKNITSIKTNKLYVVVAILLINIFNVNNLGAQQNAQWPFYIAFEDAIGAKDTLWMVYDTAAVYPNGVSPNLGEIPLSPEDTLGFHVWCYLFLGVPYEKYSGRALDPSNDYLSTTVYAENYVLPLTASWDTTLFTADILYETGDPVRRGIMDSDYFFGNNNGSFSWFELTLDNHVTMYEFFAGTGNHFPISLYLERGPLTPIVGVNDIESNYLSVFPNPTAGLLNLQFPSAVSGTLKVYNSKGKLVLSKNVSSDREQVDLQNAADGLYYAVYEEEERRIVKKVVLRK